MIGASERRAYSLDASGSVETLEDPSGAKLGTYNYDPYGELIDPDPSDGQDAEASLGAEAKQNPFRMQGFYYDQKIGSYDMQARQYQPSVGRFLSQDRFEDSGADLQLQLDPLTQGRSPALLSTACGSATGVRCFCSTARHGRSRSPESCPAAVPTATEQRRGSWQTPEATMLRRILLLPAAIGALGELHSPTAIASADAAAEAKSRVGALEQDLGTPSRGSVLGSPCKARV